MKSVLYGAVGLYAVFCFWCPVLWLVQTYMESDDFFQFRFGRLHWAEQLSLVLVATMSFITTLVIFTNLKGSRRENFTDS